MATSIRVLSGALVRFLLGWVPVTLIAVIGLAMGVMSDDRAESIIGWVVLAIFGPISIMMLLSIRDGLRTVRSIEKITSANMVALEERDAQLFTEGKSFEEVMAHYHDGKKG